MVWISSSLLFPSHWHLNFSGGVTALIHAAAPAAFKTPNAEELLKHAVAAAMNIIRQAVKAGITKIVYTSSTVTSTNGDWTKPLSNKGEITFQFDVVSYNDKSQLEWNTMTSAEAIIAGPWPAYAVGKTLSEKAVWTFAAEHPEVDITVLNPHLILGPLAPGVFLEKGEVASISTSTFLYSLINGSNQFTNVPGAVDVRDVARMHIGALKSSPAPDKRVLIAAPFPMNYAVALEAIKEKRPQLSGGLADIEIAKKLPRDQIFVDQKRIAEVTGLTVGDYTSWVDTVLDGVDSLAVITADW